MERVVALLCNPSAGGGRAARVLPEVEAALHELDVSFHSEITRDPGHPAVRVLRAGELHVAADRPFAVHADGDPIGQTPATIRVIPRAVGVLAPL